MRTDCINKIQDGDDKIGELALALGIFCSLGQRISHKGYLTEDISQRISHRGYLIRDISQRIFQRIYHCSLRTAGTDMLVTN